MPRRRKGAVRKGHGVMCNICGLNCGKGGPLKKHIEGEHNLSYSNYRKCFYDHKGKLRTIIADAWDDSVMTAKGNTVVTHVLVRRFVGHPGPRGVPRAARTHIGKL